MSRESLKMRLSWTSVSSVSYRHGMRQMSQFARFFEERVHSHTPMRNLVLEAVG